MRSNPSCKVCECYLRDVIDKYLAAGKSAHEIITGLSVRVNRSLSKYDEFDISYQAKRITEELTEADIAEKNKLLAELDMKRNLLEISAADIEEHEKEHRTFSDDQIGIVASFDDGDIFEGVDFTQHVPDVALGGNAVGIVFKKCDLTNCVVPSACEIEDCVVRRVSFCGNLYEGLEGLDCGELCEHVVRNDAEIVIDGVVVLRNVIEYADRDLADG